MNDTDRLLEILDYDIETFVKEAEAMTEEDALLIQKIGEEFSIPHSNNRRNLILRGNLILAAIRSYKQESNFILKAAELQIIFSDEKQREMVADLNDTSIAYTFATPEPNVAMYGILSKNMSRVLDNNNNKQLVK